MVSSKRNHNFHGWRGSPETPEAFQKTFRTKKLEKKTEQTHKYRKLPPNGPLGEAKRRPTNQHFLHFFDVAPLGVPWGPRVAKRPPRTPKWHQNVTKTTAKWHQDRVKTMPRTTKTEETNDTKIQKNIDKPITLCGHGGGKAEGNWISADLPERRAWQNTPRSQESFQYLPAMAPINPSLQACSLQVSKLRILHSGIGAIFL